MMINRITSTPFTSTLKKAERAIRREILGEDPKGPYQPKVPNNKFTAQQLDSLALLDTSKMQQTGIVISKIGEYEDAIDGLGSLVTRLTSKMNDAKVRYTQITGDTYVKGETWAKYFGAESSEAY